jgi:PhnB protein
MLSDEAPDYGAIAPTTLNGTSCALVLEVDDVDAAFERALGAGATEDRPITEAPYGRGGWLTDPFGHRWHVMRPDPDFDPAKL